MGQLRSRRFQIADIANDVLIQLLLFRGQRTPKAAAELLCLTIAREPSGGIFSQICFGIHLDKIPRYGVFEVVEVRLQTKKTGEYQQGCRLLYNGVFQVLNCIKTGSTRS